MKDLGERFLTKVFELFDVGPTFPKTEIISVQCRGGRNSALWIIDHNGEQNWTKSTTLGCTVFRTLSLKDATLFEPEMCDLREMLEQN